ncbi:MAG: PAS domain S-box protein [Bacteroidota bacterium]
MRQMLEKTVFRTLDAIKHTVIYVGDENANIVYITPSVEHLLGFPTENYYKEGFWVSLMHPDDRVILNDFFTRIDEINEFKVTIRFKKSDGSYQSIINSGTIVREDNKFVSITGNLKKLKEDESNKTVLDISSSYSELLLDNIGLIFYAIDRDFRIVAKNKLFDKFVWERDKIIYKIGDSIFHPKIPKNIVKEYTKAYQHCMSNGFFTMLFPGEDREYEIAFSPILMKNTVEGVSVFQFNKSSDRNLLNTASYLSNAIENKGIAAQELIYTLDKDFKFISFNEPFSKLYFSFLNKYPINGQLNEFIHGDSIVSINLRNWYSKALNGDNIDTVLYLGDQIIHLKITPNYTTNQEICGLTAINKDITTLNESQKKLIESEDKYKYVVDHVTDIVFQTDQQGFWSYLNNAWKNIMEYEIAESVGTLFFNYLHPDDVERNQILFTPLINREKSYCTHEIRYITKSGNIKWIRVYATLLVDKEDNIMGTTGTLKDITLEKENSYRYELLSKNVNDLICLLETDGTFLYVSPSFSSILGYTLEELTRKNIKEFLHPEDKESIFSFSNDQNSSKNLVTYTTFRFKNKTGGYHWIETNAKVFYDDFYGRKLINSSSRIIDERKILEQQLINSLQKERDLNQLKSKFVSMASHEFRTPMTTIKTSAELAALYLDNHSESNIAKAKKHIHTIDGEIDRLSVLINDILLLGKIESETFKLNRDEQDIIQILNEVIKKQNGLQDDKRTTKLVVIGNPQLIEIDKNYIDLIFDNLLSNAFKYSKEKSSPEIKLQFLPEGIKVLIKDYGIGIPEVEQAQMFKSFFRASNAQNLKGTGIGLVLVHYFIDLHQGNVAFESIQNDGTTFTISLPYHATKE